MQVFRTSEQDTRAQYDYWHSLIEQSFAVCEGRAVSRAGFDAALEIASCGDAELTELTSAPVRYERSRRHISVSGTDDFFVSTMLRGEAYFTQNERRVRHAAGSVLFYDSGQPYKFDYPETYHATLLRVPRPLMESRMIGASTLGGTVLPAEMPQSSLICSLVTNLIGMARREDLPSSFAAPAFDLIAGSLSKGMTGESGITDSRRAALTKIKRFIIDNLADENLSITQISAEQNISVRSLNRIFADDGTTPMAWLQRKRLARAYSLLSEGRSRSVTETAFDCGFKDLSNFGRSFKKTYGMTPRQVFDRH